MEQKQRKFSEVIGENSRTYIYPDGFTYDVFNVVAINVSSSGGHRLTAVEKPGVVKRYYIAPGWRVIKIDADEWSV